MPHRFVWKRLVSFFVHRVLHVHDTPHRIALGVATGIFVAWTPTIGFQMALTVALAWLLGANKAVGVPFVWISCPLTFVPIVVIYRRKMHLFHLDGPPEGPERRSRRDPGRGRSFRRRAKLRARSEISWSIPM